MSSPGGQPLPHERAGAGDIGVERRVGPAAKPLHRQAVRKADDRERGMSRIEGAYGAPAPRVLERGLPGAGLRGVDLAELLTSRSPQLAADFHLAEIDEVAM